MLLHCSTSTFTGRRCWQPPLPSDPLSFPVTEDHPVPNFLLPSSFLTQIPLCISNQMRTSLYMRQSPYPMEKHFDFIVRNLISTSPSQSTGSGPCLSHPKGPLTCEMEITQIDFVLLLINIITSTFTCHKFLYMVLSTHSIQGLELGDVYML